MKKLILLFALALPVLAATFDNIVVRHGDQSIIYGGEPREDAGRHYASFEKDGVAYVIADPATLKRIMAAMEPQLKLGREQARLGEEQARLGAKQAALGAEQAAIGAEQAARAYDRARASELAAEQRKLQERQAELAEQQRPLADQQQALAEKQREASERARKRIESIFEEAIRSGVAKRR